MNVPLNDLAREAERERIGAIMGSAESDLRSGLARHLAFETDFTVAESLDVLRRSPVDQGRAAEIATFFRARRPICLDDAPDETPAPFEAACHHPPSP